MTTYCPLCGRRLVYEEGSSGGVYAYCPRHAIIGDVISNALVLDQWVTTALTTQEPVR